MLLMEALILSLSQSLESRIKTARSLSFAVWSSSSVLLRKRPLFEVKRACLVFRHDLERGNKFLLLKSCVKFSSNKVEVACCLHLSRKIRKRDRNCNFYIINKQSNHSSRTVYNGNSTELRPNRSVIIKLGDRVVGVRFHLKKSFQ